MGLRDQKLSERQSRETVNNAVVYRQRRSSRSI